MGTTTGTAMTPPTIFPHPHKYPSDVSDVVFAPIVEVIEVIEVVEVVARNISNFI